MSNTTELMQAVVRERYVEYSQLRVGDVPVPTVGAGQVRVKVSCTAVSRTDCAQITGRPFPIRFFSGLFKPTRPVTGCDFVGEVVEAGSGAEFNVGERVYGFHDEGMASHAQFVVPRAGAAVMRVPDGISDESAAASLEGAHYATHFLRVAPPQPGMRVLVNGATGAIGSAVTQLAVHYGAEVTAVSAPERMQEVSSYGVREVLDYTKDDFTALGTTFDVIADAVGKSSFGKCKPLMKPGAWYLSSELGPHAENIPLGILGVFWRGKRVRMAIPHDLKGSMAKIRPHLQSGAFKPMIDRHFSMTEISEAFEYVDSGRKLGNVILDIPA